MKRYLNLILSLVAMNTAVAQNLNSAFVNLKGEKSFTILKNTTNDTLNVKGRSFYNLPYYETDIAFTILPGKQDTIISYLAYPDFIFLFSPNIQIWNAPGKTVVCELRQTDTKALGFSFSGDLVLENNYYLEYHNYFKGGNSEVFAYYKAGEMATDFNQFPVIADSISNVFLTFLKSYNKQLPGYFKPYEASRLKYNGAFRKYNVLFSKDFRGDLAVPVNSSYFDFESIPLVVDTIILSNEYLHYVTDYIGNQTDLRLFNSRTARMQNKEVLSLSEMMITADEVLPSSELRDAVKMNFMSLRYKMSKLEYSRVLQESTFYNRFTRSVIDSITTLKSKFPLVGKPAPEIAGVNIEGEAVSLSQFKDQTVILNFWASWCAPCIKEFPYENAIHHKYSSTDLTIVNVCVETDLQKWGQLSKQHNLQMINLFVSETQYKRIKAVYNLESLPRSVLIGKDQQVVDNYYKPASAITEKDLAVLLQEIPMKR